MLEESENYAILLNWAERPVSTGFRVHRMTGMITGGACDEKDILHGECHIILRDGRIIGCECRG